MQKTIVVIAVLLVILGGWYLARSKSEPGNIKVGFIAPLTGDASALGVATKAAVEVAVEEINNSGGINGSKLKVIYEDGQCNAKAAVTAGNKLISIDKVPVIIGGLCSTETSAFAPAAMQNKVLVFSPCSSAPSLSNLGKYFFRSYPSDAYQGKFAAEYAYNDLKARKVAIGYHISDWGTGIKEIFETRFKELGGQVVAEEGAPQDARDYRTLLGKLKAAKPDLIYLPTYPDGGIVAITQANELGIKTKIFGGDGWDDPKFVKAVSGKGDLIFSVAATREPAGEFRQKVLAKTNGEQVPLCAPQAYDNLKMLAEVMKKVGLDPDKMQAELRSMHYDGVSGSISFDKNGDLTTVAYVVKRIENGTVVEIK